MVPDRKWSGGVAVCLAGAQSSCRRAGPAAASPSPAASRCGNGDGRCLDSRRVRLDRAVWKVATARLPSSDAILHVTC